MEKTVTTVTVEKKYVETIDNTEILWLINDFRGEVSLFSKGKEINTKSFVEFLLAMLKKNDKIVITITGEDKDDNKYLLDRIKAILKGKYDFQTKKIIT